MLKAFGVCCSHCNLHFPANLPHPCQEFAEGRPILLDLTGEDSLKVSCRSHFCRYTREEILALSIISWAYEQNVCFVFAVYLAACMPTLQTKTRRFNAANHELRTMSGLRWQQRLSKEVPSVSTQEEISSEPTREGCGVAHVASPV